MKAKRKTKRSQKRLKKRAEARSSQKRTKQLEEQALALLRDPLFLFNAKEKVHELGVVGEDRNILALIVASITRQTPDPVSVIIQSPPSTGKSTLMKKVTELLPPECVIERAGLSKRALAFGKVSFTNKILFVNQYDGGKDAQLFIRLTQSGESVKHEYTTIAGRRRKTEVAERVGIPGVWTTASIEIYQDDISRFLRLTTDNSRKQNLAICLSHALAPRTRETSDLPHWQAAMSKIAFKSGDFEAPSEFLSYVAKHLPLDNAGVRREWDRIMSCLRAVALLRGFESREPVNIEFADYCVVYQILEPILASTLKHTDSQEYAVAKAAAMLNRKLRRPVTVREIAEELRWKERLVYKHLKTALHRKLVRYKRGTRENNQKLIIAKHRDYRRFLPSPRSVLKHNPAIGKKVRYVDPFTGRRKRITR